MNKEEMVEKFQCPGCVGGPDPKSCPAFKLQELSLGGFNCEAHVPGTGMLGTALDHPDNGNGLVFLLGMPPPFDTLTNDARKNHLMVLGNVRTGAGFLDISGPQNVPIWKTKHDGCTIVRIARPSTLRYTTLVIDGDVEVPAPAVEVGEGDGSF